MLQQTQVSRVVTYYDEFLTTFPTLHDVARARPKRVMEAWAGLGYYARARNLHALARHVTDRGRDADATLPAEPEALRALPGIGAYTAGAVSSFAYERRAELVDTNVARAEARVRPARRHQVGARAEGDLAHRTRAAAANRLGDVDAQPGADGAGRAGLHSARGAMHGVSGALRVREPAIGGCELAGTPPPRAADDLEDRRYLVKTRILPCCEKLSVLFVIVTGTVE